MRRINRVLEAVRSVAMAVLDLPLQPSNDAAQVMRIGRRLHALGRHGGARHRAPDYREHDGGRNYCQLLIRETPAISKSSRTPATNTPTLTMKRTNSKLLKADSQRISVRPMFTTVGGGVRGSTPPHRGIPVRSQRSTVAA